MKKSLIALCHWSDKLGVENFYSLNADGNVRLQGKYTSALLLNLKSNGFILTADTANGYLNLTQDWDGLIVTATLT